MSNVTKALGVVRDLDALTTLVPPPGTQLAVFRRSRRGEEPLGILAPGEAFQPRLFERRSALRLLAVSTDPNLRHEFSQSYLHRDQVHSFVLRFRMGYRVTAPERLVETLPQDPLARIEKEVIEVVGRSVQVMPWSEVEQHREEVGRRALNLSPATADGFHEENLVRLRRFCGDHGVELLDLDVACVLDEPAVEVDVVRDEEERTQKKLRLTQATEKVRRLGEQEIRREEKLLERDILAIDRSQKLADQVLAHLDHALGKVANGVDSAPTLRSAILELSKLQQQLHQVTAISAPEVRQLAGGGDRLLVAAPDALGSHAEFLSTLLEHVSGLDCSDEERSRLLGRALRTFGLALADDRPQARAALEEEVEALERTLDGRVRALRSPEQRAFFRDLCDPRWWERWV